MIKNKKSSFVFVFLLLCVFLLSGCTPVGTVSLLESAFFAHTVYFSQNNTITETVLVNFANTPLESAEKQTLMLQLNALFASQRIALTNEYVQALAADEQNPPYLGTFAISNQVEGEKVMIKITYQNADAWRYFSSFSTASSLTITNQFFTYTRTDHKQKTGSVTHLGGTEQYFGDYMKAFTFDWMALASPNTVQSVSTQSVYAYVTYFSRRHSNADAIAPFSGNYFHIWNTSMQEPNITLWLVLPRVQNWYITGLALAFATLGIVMLFSFFIKDKSQKKMVVEEKARIKTIEE